MEANFEKYGTRMPYKLPEGAMDDLRRTVRERISSRRAFGTMWRGAVVTAFAATAAIVVCGAVIISERNAVETSQSTLSIECLLQEAPRDAIEQAAANSYDDIIFNQQI